MPAKPLLLGLVLAGCLGADAGAPAPELDETLPALSEPALGTASRPDTLDTERLRACIGEDGPPPGVELYVLGHASLPDGMLAEVTWMRDERDAAAPNGAALVVEGAECHVLSSADPDAVWRAARELQADPAVRDRQIGLQIAATGGLRSFKSAIDTHRGADWLRPRECGPNEPIAEGLCLRAPEAAAWRRAGLDVPPPHFGATANPALGLSHVPERLHTCLPASLREERELTDVEVLYSQTSGPVETVVLATYPDGWVVPEGVTPDIIVARTTSDIACEILFDSRTESWTEDPDAPLARDVLLSEAFRRHRAEVEVRRGGGAEGFLRLYREQTGTQGPVACPSSPPDGYEGRCADAAEAATLRRLGVPVAPALR